MHEAEGVIKFVADHEPCEPTAELTMAVAALAPWRQILRDLGILGRDARRYGGFAFGNISIRLPSLPENPDTCRFAISGVQTSGLEEVDSRHFVVVEDHDIGLNRVVSRGPILPSSESLTHAMAYDLSRAVGAVFHVHSPSLWSRAQDLGLPWIEADIAYGTQEMALAVERLWKWGKLPETRIFAMGGHPDGIVAFGRSPHDTGACLLGYL